MIEDKESYISVKPNNEVLQQYIAYYYFNASDTKDYKKKFIFYPHYKNALTVYKNAKINFSENASHVIPNNAKNYEITYTGIHSEGRIGIIDAPFNKLGIVYQPLGINSFLRAPLSEVIKESPKSDFDYFGQNFIGVLDFIYGTDKLEEKINGLDDFFNGQLQPIEEQRIISAVSLLLDEDLSIQNLSQRLNISRKTLLRLFKKHLNCTPKTFATIVKFRKALNLYQSKENKPQLTQFAYENEYYDQSDFIKHFKKVTGFNPKNFFANISHLGSEDTFWTLLEN